MGLQEEMAECRAEVGAVHVGLALRSRVVDVRALRAEDLARVHSRHVTLTDGEYGLALAKRARAAAKVRVLILLEHRVHPARRDDEARVDEAVKELRRRLDRLLLLLGEARGRRALHIEDGVQRELVVRHLCAQSRQVEVVLDEVLLHLREELIALERAEPRDPRRFFNITWRKI
eukprot:CAMPEP_0119076548 /NCGR_PEP_ID=MMETSP1178-20130426/87857_1 /TAXON_ID=33656 /ORGANISM="unid sp, Strain CCMP2000" /LENGTH=174 /DNA_ID=CAMNT_0007058841 /DNA_START=45 /DNA_END=569 /DNA_ORIENTATION=-